MDIVQRLISERINRANVNGQEEVRLAMMELREAVQKEMNSPGWRRNARQFFEFTGDQIPVHPHRAVSDVVILPLRK